MLIGFAPTNHPQQIGKRGASDKVDERITPAWLFNEWNARFHFTLDAAASADNAKCQTYFTLGCSGLEMPWAGHSVWCNPPFSNCRAWVEKAWREWEDDLPARSIVMMLPANRTEQRWWTDLIEPRRDIIGSPLRTTFLARRINFGLPGNPEGKFNSSPPFGVVMLVWERHA